MTSGAFTAGIAVLILAAIIVVLRLVAPGVLVAVASPFFRAGSSLAQNTRALTASFESTKNLLASESALQQENTALASENATLAAKVADLEKLLGGAREAAPGMVAGVLARPPESPYDTLIINGGSADGVVLGERVYGPGGFPLGSVESVMQHYARIVLFSAPNISIDGWVGTARAPITLTGQGGGSFTARTSRTSSIAVGDIIYVAGPGALALGTVAGIDNDPSSPIETLHIRSSANLFSITWVELREGGSGSWPALLVSTTTSP